MSVIPAQAGYERSTNLIKVTPDGEVVWKRFILPRRWRRRRYNVNGGWHPRVVCAVVLVQAITGTDAVAVLVQQRSTSGSVTAFNTPISSWCLMRIDACGCVEWERYFSEAAYSNATYGEADDLISTIPTGRDSVGGSDTEHEGWGNLLSLTDGTLLLYYRNPTIALSVQHVFETINHNTGDTIATWPRPSSLNYGQFGPWPMLRIPESDEWLQNDPSNASIFSNKTLQLRERCEMSAELWERSEIRTQSEFGSTYVVNPGVNPRHICVQTDGDYASADSWINASSGAVATTHIRRGLTVRSGAAGGGVVEGAPATMLDPGSDPAILAQHCPISYNSVHFATNGYDPLDRSFTVKSVVPFGSDYIVCAVLDSEPITPIAAKIILRRYNSGLVVQWELEQRDVHRLLNTDAGMFTLAADGNAADNNNRHLSRIDPADGSVIWRLRSEVRHTITATDDGMLWLGGAENLTTYSLD